MTLYVVEHKTSSEDISLGSTYWKRLTLDPQISLYIEGARHLGYDVKGVLYDVLRKPAHRLSKGETDSDFEKRVINAIAEDNTKYYQQGVVVRLASDRNEAACDVWNSATALRDSKRLNVWPRNPDACIQWSRTCDYFPVCTGESDIEDSFRYRIESSAHTELDVSDEEKSEDNHEAPLQLLTQSSLRTFRSCQRKYHYRYEKKARPIVDSEALSVGKRIHEALEIWWSTSGDITAALNVLSDAKERAMMVGYHARWSKPPKVIAVEKEFRMPLINPKTGAASKTFELAGKIDAICEVEDAF